MGTNTTTENGVTKTLTVTGPNAGPAIFAPAPATSASAGQPGQVATDGAYFYVCVAANSWKRAALSAF